MAAETQSKGKQAIIRYESYLFVPVDAETMGAMNNNEVHFLGDLGRRITQHDHRIGKL